MEIVISLVQVVYSLCLPSVPCGVVGHKPGHLLEYAWGNCGRHGLNEILVDLLPVEWAWLEDGIVTDM